MADESVSTAMTPGEDFLLCPASPADYAWRVEDVKKVVYAAVEDSEDIVDFAQLSGLTGTSRERYTLLLRAPESTVVVRGSGALEFRNFSEKDVVELPDLCRGRFFSRLVMQGGVAAAWVVDPARLFTFLYGAGDESPERAL